LECVETVISFIGKLLGSFVLIVVTRYYWVHLIWPHLLGSLNSVTDWLVGQNIRIFVLDYVEGLSWSNYKHLATKSAKASFHWEEPCLVGNTLSFTVTVIHILGLDVYAFSYFNYLISLYGVLAFFPFLSFIYFNLTRGV